MLEFAKEYPMVLVALIFFARILDVTIGTVRTILVFRGHRYFAALLGFFEVLVWLVAAGSVIQNLDTWYLAITYAAGFATGNICGMWIESKIALGSELVRAVSENRNVDLAMALRQKGYSVTELPGIGDDEQPIEVLLIVEKRRKVPELLMTISKEDPDAFWTVSDVKRQPIIPPITTTMATPRLRPKG